MYIVVLSLLAMLVFWLFGHLLGAALYLLIVTIGRLIIYWQVTVPTILFILAVWQFGLITTLVGMGITLLIFVLLIVLINLDNRDSSHQN